MRIRELRKRRVFGRRWYDYDGMTYMLQLLNSSNGSFELDRWYDDIDPETGWNKYSYRVLATYKCDACEPLWWLLALRWAKPIIRADKSRLTLQAMQEL